MKRIASFLVFTVAGIYFLTRTFLPALTAMTHSFPAYYTASRLVLDGRFGALAYQDAWFEARVLEMTQGRVSDHFSLHPPITWLLLAPIAWLDLTTARIIWQILNLALLIAGLWLLTEALRITNVQWQLLFFAFAFVYPPLAENIRVGQTYVLLFFLFVLALWNELRAHPFGTGIGLGIAAGLKLSGAPVWLVLGAQGRWRALFWSVTVLLCTGILGFIVLGGGAWLGFFQRVSASFQSTPVASHLAFQTTPSFLQRMFVASPEYNPMPLFDAPQLAAILNLGVLLVAFGILLWRARRATFSIAFAAAVTSGVILFPMATEYHYTLLLLPLAVMGKELLDTPERFQIIGFAVILILLCAPFDWNSAQLNQGAWTLLAYPRLVAGWLLWLILIVRMKPLAPSIVLPQMQLAQ